VTEDVLVQNTHRCGGTDRRPASWLRTPSDDDQRSELMANRDHRNAQYLVQRAADRGTSLEAIVNDLLKREIQIIESVKKLA